MGSVIEIAVTLLLHFFYTVSWLTRPVYYGFGADPPKQLGGKDTEGIENKKKHQCSGQWTPSQDEDELIAGSKS